MARFYFNLEGDSYCEDREGTELPGLPEARSYVSRYASALASASIAEDGRVTLSDGIVVTDDAGHLLFVVRLEDVITYAR